MRGYVVRAVVVAALLATTTPGVSAGVASATLDGRSIEMGQVGSLACHDFEFPIIRCFDSVAQLEADVALEITSQRTPRALATVSSGYVIVFENIAYGGSNPKVLSSDVPWLSDIGWNDKISSFKSYGASGEFWENSPNGGFAYYYGPTTQVSYVGDFYNDKFSSFYID